MEAQYRTNIEPWTDIGQLLHLPIYTNCKRQDQQPIPTSKALSRLLKEIYQASATMPLGKFEDYLFYPIQEYLGFDSAWLGRSTITERGPVLHESYTYGLPENYVAEWEKITEEDPFAPQVTASPGKAVVMRVTEAGMTQNFREFAGKFGLAQFMCAIDIDPVLKTCTHLSLYREKLLPHFDHHAMELLEGLISNLAAAITMNRVRHVEQLRADTTKRKFSTAICNQQGIIQFAESNFGELMLMEWPEWKGSRLPSSLIKLTGQDSDGLYAGKSIVSELESRGNNLLIVTLRLKAATDLLTPRELAITRMFGAGKTYKEVAKHLGISPATVRHHLRQAYTKLNVQNKGEIACLLR